jgi:hypothetical protein
VRLGCDVYVRHVRGRLRNRETVRVHALDVERNGLADFEARLFDRIPSSHAPRQVGHVCAVIIGSSLDHGRVFHVVPSFIQALRCYRCRGGAADVKRMLDKEQLEPLIFVIRGCRVVLDADLARLYGVDTFRFNEAFKRNRRRFPPDFAFQLTSGEFETLRSQIVTSSSQAVDSLRHNSSQFAMSSQRGHRYLPWAFTEHGALMAANILRSDRAVQMSVFVVRAFVRLREHIAANTAVMARLAEIDKTLLEHDAALCDLYRKLLPLLQPPADPPKRRIGFHPEDQ